MVECQIRHIQGMMDFKKIISGYWKPTVKILQGAQYLHILKVFLHQLFFNYKEKSTASTLETLGGYHLNQGTKANITNTGTSQHHVPLDMMYWGGQNVISVVFLWKIYNLNLIMRKRQTNPGSGVVYKITCLYSSKILRLKNTGKGWTLFQIKGD